MSNSQPMLMKTNLIIPCGTSQLEKLLGMHPPLSCSPTTQSQVEEAFALQLRVGPEDYLGSRLVRDAIDDIVKRLVTELHIELDEKNTVRPKKILKPEHVRDNWWAENPFGSELSTLIRLEDRLNLAPKESYTPPHRLVLLASETPAGLMARRVLRKVLEHEYGYRLKPIDPDKEKSASPQPGVKEELVAGLTEIPNNPEVAEITLVEIIRRNLFSFDSGWCNLFLVTGGFKSILPCLTMLSLLYGIEMVYLFEHSPQVQRFKLVEAGTAPEKEAWRGEWLKLMKDGKLKPSGCLETIFLNWSQSDRAQVEPLYR